MPATRPNGPHPTADPAGARPCSVEKRRDHPLLHSSADERLLVDIADALRRRRLAPLAVLWLESFRPLTFLGSQALHAVAPLCAVFLPRLPLARLADLFEDRDTLDRFLAYLTSDDADRRAAAPAEPGGTA